MSRVGDGCCCCGAKMAEVVRAAEGLIASEESPRSVAAESCWPVGPKKRGGSCEDSDKLSSEVDSTD